VLRKKAKKKQKKRYVTFLSLSTETTDFSKQSLIYFSRCSAIPPFMMSSFLYNRSQKPMCAVNDAIAI